MQDCEPIVWSLQGPTKAGSALTRAPSGRRHGNDRPQSAEALSRGQPPLTVSGGVETRLNKQHTVHRRAVSCGPLSAGAEVPKRWRKGPGKQCARAETEVRVSRARSLSAGVRCPSVARIALLKGSEKTGASAEELYVREGRG